MNIFSQEKERAKDLVTAGKQCETMATELLALAAGSDSAGRILTATDRKNTEFLDVLIENEQKEVIAHTVVQRYLQVIMIISIFEYCKSRSTIFIQDFPL